jgi:cytochrome oxidase assembly protein ShyY1
MAAKLGVHSCSCSADHQSCPYLVNNVVINGGKDKTGAVDLNVNRVMRCREAQADTAFIWFAFGTFLATFALALLAWRRGGKI